MIRATLPAAVALLAASSAWSQEAPPSPAQTTSSVEAHAGPGDCRAVIDGESFTFPTAADLDAFLRDRGLGSATGGEAPATPGVTLPPLPLVESVLARLQRPGKPQPGAAGALAPAAAPAEVRRQVRVEARDGKYRVEADGEEHEFDSVEALDGFLRERGLGSAAPGRIEVRAEARAEKRGADGAPPSSEEKGGK